MLIRIGIPLLAILVLVIALAASRAAKNKPESEVRTIGGSTPSATSSSGTGDPSSPASEEGALSAEGVASEEDDSDQITILSVGDNLIHNSLFENAATDDGYDFSPLYRNVTEDIQAAYIATINQETPLATSLGEPAGYPSFNTPSEVADALKACGFDLLTLANNHMMDMGEAGIDATLDKLDEIDLPYVGAYRGSEDRDEIRVIEKDGIRVAFLGVTEIMNQDVPDSAEGRIIFLDEEERIQSLIEDADAQADIVVMHAHWGTDGSAEITDSERTMAQKMVDWGADIIFGSHPHVLQDLTVLTRESDGQLCPVAFSLGNFISGQKECAELVSGLLTVSVKRDENSGEVIPAAMHFEPVITQYEPDRADTRVIPLSEYNEELAAAHGVRDYDEPLTLDIINSILDEKIPAQYLNQDGALTAGD